MVLPCKPGICNQYCQSYFPYLKALASMPVSTYLFQVSMAARRKAFENSVGKGENAGNQHFLLSPQCFQKQSLSGSLKVGIMWKRVICGLLDTTFGILHTAIC